MSKRKKAVPVEEPASRVRTLNERMALFVKRNPDAQPCSTLNSTAGLRDRRTPTQVGVPISVIMRQTRARKDDQ